MPKLDGPKIFAIFAVCLMFLTIFYPETISNKNKFLKDFVNHEFLALITVTSTISLAWIGQIYESLRKIESDFEVRLENTRSSLNKSANSIMILLVYSVFVVVGKGWCDDEEYGIQAWFHSNAVLIICFNMSVMYDLVKTTRRLPPTK